MIVAFYRRQMVENLKKMQELKAQIQAQMKLAETLKKLSENAGTYRVFFSLDSVRGLFYAVFVLFT